MRKRSQKEETHTSSDLKRYLGVLHEEHMETIKAVSHEEHMETIKAVSEQFVDVNRKLDSHTDMIGKLAEDMVVVKSDLDTVKSDLGAVQSDIEIMKSDIGIIKTDLKQKVDRTEFATLERRVVRLESKVK